MTKDHSGEAVLQSPSAPAGIRFEESLRMLEDCVKILEQGELDLEKSMEVYVQGVEWAKACQRRLSEVEQKIEKLAESSGPTERE